MTIKDVAGCHLCPCLRWAHADYVTCALKPGRNPLNSGPSDFDAAERAKIRAARYDHGPAYAPSWCPLPVKMRLDLTPEPTPEKRQPVYIAGPFAACEGRTERENVCRAMVLTRFAQWRGLAPICVHPTILAGGYGDGTKEKDREAGLETCLRTLDAVHAVLGAMWVILRDDGLMSEGTAREVRHAVGLGMPMLRCTWESWVQTMRGVDFPAEA